MSPEPTWLAEPGGDESLERNWLFELRRERFRSRLSGKTHDYYVLHLSDVVNVVALTAERQVLLVRQFRAGSRHDSLETPGGLLDPGEDPCAAAVRELLEETGHAGDPPRALVSLWMNPSLLSARVTFVLVENTRQVCEPSLDHSEERILEPIPADQIHRAISDGRIDHSLSVCALLWWLSRSS
jgi:8-oxo-dGTP pyrophosphatase MutT (NUDIX family)